MNKERDNVQNLIDFAGRIGKLEQGLKDLTKHFTNHLHRHFWDRFLQWAIMALQVIVIIVLGVLLSKII
jgi:hypothetical protein